MNTSGEAADQVVRMSLQAGEAALKISGTGAKQLAAFLYTVLKEQKKTKGRARLETLVRSGKPLTVFSVREGDLKQFVQEARRYGILYCAVRNPRGSGDGTADIMVKEEDAPRINRIVERFQLASVARAAETQTETGKAEKNSQAEQEKERPLKSREDLLVDELLEGRAGRERAVENPSLAKAEKTHLSEPASGRRGRTAGGTSKPYQPSAPEKPSVRRELREIQRVRKKEAEAADREPSKSGNPKGRSQTGHKQLQAEKKRKEKGR